MLEYNTVYTSQSSRAVFTGVWAGAGAGRGGAKYQISGAEKCQNPFGGNLDTGASPALLELETNLREVWSYKITTKGPY